MPHTPDSSQANSKRSASGFAGPSRSKRAKYATAACNECKKRKLKCVKHEHQSVCQRCRANELECVFAHKPQPPPQTSQPPPLAPIDSGEKALQSQSQPSENDLYILSKAVASLQAQISTLSTTLQDLDRRLSSYQPPRSVVTYQGPSPSFAGDSTVQPAEPRQPHFVGPTRSAFSLQIAEASLHRMGIDTEGRTASSSPAASPRTTPRFEGEPSQGQFCISDSDSLLGFELDDVLRLLDDYIDEIESVYPFTEIREISAKAPYILERIRRSQRPTDEPTADLADPWPDIEIKDVQILKVALAISGTLEANSQNPVSKSLVDDVEPVVCRVSGEAKIDLKELQIMTMLSIYWFHCGEELLAWRAIGISTREVLELGLHRRPILFENYKDPKERDLAIRTFWCVYILDRRWSFGTSLSFGLIDNDIDSELPEPGEDFPFLRCMAAYSRLSAKVWEAFPPSGVASQVIPKNTVSLIDFMTQNWISSIPEDLRLRHPRLGLAPRQQPRVTHRLRALLYLHGNHLRKLIYRHHIISSASIRADMHSARLVVGIAQDSIEVLVHLHRNSDIYSRQQNEFNFFLLSAIASILLAVCNAPHIFAQQCRESFIDAVELIRGFSRHGSSSRALWKSIRRLLPGMKTVGLRADGDTDKVAVSNTSNRAPPQVIPEDARDGQPSVEPVGELTSANEDDASLVGLTDNMWPIQSDIADRGNSPMASFDLGEGLVDLFDAFGQMDPDGVANSEYPSDFFNLGGHSMSFGDSEEFVRRFHGFL